MHLHCRRRRHLGRKRGGMRRTVDVAPQRCTSLAMNVTTAKGSIRKPLLPGLSRYISAFHRWLGIALCLMFAMWFATGSVLSFVPFPALSADERIARSEPLDMKRLGVDFNIALAAVGTRPIERARLISVQGEPRYVLSLRNQPAVSISAQTGQTLPQVSSSTARAIAAEFSGHEIGAIRGPFDYDQWTVHGAYDAYRPFYKLSARDAAGTELYVSARTGEVLQWTRRNERAWNYIGAVAHWINPTFLRKHYAPWREVIWILSLSGVVFASAGLFLGVIRYLNWKRQRRSGLSPFRGLLRWHHSIGLFAGLLVLSWILTGWLGLDGIVFFSDDQPTAAQIERMRAVSLTDAARAFPVSVLAQLGAPREIEFTALAGRPLLLLRDRSPGSARVLSIVPGMSGVRTDTQVPDGWLSSAIQGAWPAVRVVRVEHIDSSDAYSLRVRPFPPTARRFVLDGTPETWVHMDAATGQVISIMDTSRRIHRWLVDGPHTFDFPLLNEAGPLWHVLLLMATTAGFLFSCTGVVLAFRRLRKSLS